MLVEARRRTGSHSGSSDHDHLEFVFPNTALWAFPIGRHIFPSGTGGNAFARPALGFVIDQSTNETLVGFHLLLLRGEPARNPHALRNFEAHPRPILVTSQHRALAVHFNTMTPQPHERTP